MFFYFPMHKKSYLKYIEDITRRREDMTFIFEWRKQYFTNEHSE
jgi:hypothetical protein